MHDGGMTTETFRPHDPDQMLLMPAIESIKRKMGRKPKAMLADAGYWSEKNVEALNKDRSCRR